jgi:hypothetical protein
MTHRHTQCHTHHLVCEICLHFCQFFASICNKYLFHYKWTLWTRFCHLQSHTQATHPPQNRGWLSRFFSWVYGSHHIFTDLFMPTYVIQC